MNSCNCVTWAGVFEIAVVIAIGIVILLFGIGIGRTLDDKNT